MTLFFPARCSGCEREISPQNIPVEPPEESLPHEAVEHDDDPVEINPGNLPTSLKPDFRTEFEFHWCGPCWNKLTSRPPHHCQKCGVNIFGRNSLGERCPHCHDSDLRFERAVNIGNYRGLLQELVIRLKNQHDEPLAIQLGKLLAYEIITAEFFPDLNLVVPVPTHWWRRMQRGFQAAEILAETLASDCDLPYAGQILNCNRRTQKQGTLSTTGRMKNVRGAFDLHAKINVRGLTILLVDDVMTSGATVSEISRVLLKSGAAKVYVGVIARGAGVS